MVDSTARPFFELYCRLANEGWTDDFPMPASMQPVRFDAARAGGLLHLATGLCHFIVGVEHEPFPIDAAARMAEDILIDYCNRATPRINPFNAYTPEPAALDIALAIEPAAVSFMCTSHSERQDVHSDCIAIGDFLAHHRYSATWPGNDRNNMRSLYGALKSCHRLVGVIAPHLVDVATWNGRIPDCTHPLLASHIYERMLILMMLGRVHYFFPVGLGGVLEVCARVVVDDYFPDFRDTPGVFYDAPYATFTDGESLTKVILNAFVGAAGRTAIDGGVYRDEQSVSRNYLRVQSMTHLQALTLRLVSPDGARS